MVEVRQGTLGSRVAVEQEEEERRGGEEQATDIKSNNPHLAGGEKHPIPPYSLRTKHQ